jgi:hypothetical protein
MNTTTASTAFKCPRCHDGDLEIVATVGNDRAVGVGNHIVDWRLASKCLDCGYAPDGDELANLVENHTDDLIEDAIESHYDYGPY